MRSPAASAPTVNIFYLLTFVAVAVSMLLGTCARWVCRGGRIRHRFALHLPAVPLRAGVPHLFLSAYWVVPLGAYLVLRVASARPPFTAEQEAGRGWRVRIWNRSGVLWLLACVAIASSGAYYAAFTLLFIAVLTVVDFLVRRRTRVLASGAIALAAIGIVVLFNAAPNLVYMRIHGQDTAVVRRHPSETEFEGLKISQLVLPVEQHRVGALADLQEKSTKYTPTRSERGQQLGIIGAAGFGALIVILLLAIRRDRRPPDAAADDEPEPAGVPPPRDALLSMGVLLVTAVLVAVISGFSILIFGLGFRDLRSWNRISLFVAFFAFTTVAYGLDWLRRRLPDRPWAKAATVAGLAGLLAFGILDQVSPAVIPDYAVEQARWASDDAFVKAVERDLPDGASVYELPYRYFPEAPLAGNLGPYDLVRPYLHSDTLEWGWGGMLGREADWQASTSTLPAAEMLDRVAAVGFDGLVYDLGSTYRRRRSLTRGHLRRARSAAPREPERRARLLGPAALRQGAAASGSGCRRCGSCDGAPSPTAATPRTDGPRGPVGSSDLGRLGLRGELVDEMRRHRVVVRVLHREAAATTGHRPQVDRVAQHLRGRHERHDLHLAVADRGRALDPAALGVEVAHDVALVRLGHGHHELADGLEEDRRRLRHRLLEAE